MRGGYKAAGGRWLKAAVGAGAAVGAKVEEGEVSMRLLVLVLVLVMVVVLVMGEECDLREVRGEVEQLRREVRRTGQEDRGKDNTRVTIDWLRQTMQVKD